MSTIALKASTILLRQVMPLGFSIRIALIAVTAATIFFSSDVLFATEVCWDGIESAVGAVGLSPLKILSLISSIGAEGFARQCSYSAQVQ